MPKYNPKSSSKRVDGRIEETDNSASSQARPSENKRLRSAASESGTSGSESDAEETPKQRLLLEYRRYLQKQTTLPKMAKKLGIDPRKVRDLLREAYNPHFPDESFHGGT